MALFKYFRVNLHVGIMTQEEKTVIKKFVDVIPHMEFKSVDVNCAPHLFC